jgi:predicted PurR-regulated permease PerM
MSRAQLFAVFFFAVFLYLLYQFYLVFNGFLGPLSWAGILALVFYPTYRRLSALLRQRESLAAFLLTTLVIVVVIVPTIWLTVRLASESVAAYQHVQTTIQSGQADEMIASLLASRVGRVWTRIAPQLESWNLDLRSLILKGGDAVSGVLMGSVSAMAANAIRFVVNFFLTTFALFFFFRDGERMVRGLRDLLPMERRHTDAILARFYDTLSAVVQGTLATSIAQGVLAAFGFWILDVPFVLLLSVAAAFLSLLPMGAPVVWLSVVGYLAFYGAYGKAIFLLLYGTFIISGADNVIRPLIIGGRTNIPTIFLFFGILGGMQVYGFLGVFLGPALIATLVAFIRIYREQYTTA